MPTPPSRVPRAIVRERVLVGALWGLFVGVIASPVAMGVLLEPPSIARPIWVLRAMVGGMVGGALSGALLGRLLPAMRGALASLVLGLLGASAYLVMMIWVAPGKIQPFPDGAMAFVAIVGGLGVFVGAFTRSVFLHGEIEPATRSPWWRGPVYRALNLLSRVRIDWPGLTQRRKNALRARPFPSAWDECIRRNVPYTEHLKEAEYAELRKQILVFTAVKNFEGCGGLELTDEIRVTIGAQACILTLAVDPHYYPGLRTILVYPSTFVPKRASLQPAWYDWDEPVPTLGESWHQGLVVLAWDSVLHGAANIEDGKNVVFHEFAHQLDQETGAADGIPLLDSATTYRTWAQLIGREHARLVRSRSKDEASILDHYGAKNPAEFFAVATETFFERPRELRGQIPDLYRELAGYYRQDPAAGLDGATRSKGPEQ